MPIYYPLERLFIDQDRDWVIDAIAPVLAWVPGSTASKNRQPFRFKVDQTVGAATTAETIDLTWDHAALSALVPGLADHVKRLQSGRTVQREHVTELAAYALTMVAISALMPGRRIKGFNKGSAPDILFDVTPGALKGVESAGRSTGGLSALRVVRDGVAAQGTRPAKRGKAAQLRARIDVVEAHLSLWCASPRVSILEQVKP